MSTTSDMQVQILIWSNEHQAWWRSDRMGYTGVIELAGVYSPAEAVEIVRGANLGDPVTRYGMQVPAEVLVARVTAGTIHADTVRMCTCQVHGDRGAVYVEDATCPVHHPETWKAAAVVRMLGPSERKGLEP